jgi:cytidylate kinase
MQSNISITIARELGSGGSYIGKLVANLLGYAYIDREILLAAAKELGFEEDELQGRGERLQSIWERLMSVFAIGVPDAVYTPPRRWITDEELIKTQRHLLCELAGKGNCVVLGYGAFYLLRGRTRLFNVFVHAPATFRMERVMSIYHAKSKIEAAGMIQRSDRERERYVRSFCGFDRFDARNYHLSIDTSIIDFTTAANLIISMAGKLPEETHWPWVNEPV